MKSSEDFDAFYQRELKGTIEKLDVKRQQLVEKYSFKKYWRNLKWLLLFTVLGGVARAAVPDIVPEQVGLIAAAMIAYGVIGGIYLLIKRTLAFKPVIAEYKQQVIPKIIRFVNPEMNYDSVLGIRAEEFTAGEIFRPPTYFKSEDLVHGNIDGVEVRMSDVTATRRERSGSKGDNDEITLFKGFYGIAKFGEPFSAQVILKPSNQALEALEKLGGMAKKLFGGLVASIMERMELTEIQIGHEEFDKAYLIRSSDRDQALTVLTPTLMQLILTFNKELELPVTLSFKGDQLHFGFSQMDMFELHLNQSLVEKDISKEYFRHLNLALGLVEGVKTLR